jgi:hypothetical protein
MSERTQLICARMAIPMVIMLFVGLGSSTFLTPPAPAAGADEIARMYRDNTDQIRLGLAFSFLSLILFFPFAASMVAQARRIEGTPVLTIAQTAAIGSGSLIFILPWCVWMTAAFRPAREASQILLLNDLGWLIFTFSFVAFTAWNFCLGVAILSDTRREPVFPRWLGYYNIFVGLIFCPDLLVPFFKTGPFDWRGIFPYYLPFAVYGVWLLVMMVMTVRAIRQESAENAQFDEPEAGSSPISSGRISESPTAV